ncbi:esterase OVCA2 [Histomonas meleagridis]|uniref:esterase OVCA2 n=1 Tax=Histomonas meleagridis TaxID=135588 RepID=UPI00355A14C5|nr:esterase OVCA2 [Histomonas meleagridis]KAH0806819.1 esterase OVCA2 [Histomonas meleagridis]
MKLLALHGHIQNAKRFKAQTGALVSNLKKIGITLVYIDGPIIIDSGSDDPSSLNRTWVDGDSLEASYKVIQEAKENNPDLVGIFGFSMGAMLGLQLAAHAAVNPSSPFSWIKIIVSVSSPYPKEDSPLHRLFPCTCQIPALFVIGLTDQIAPPESQRRYLQSFPNSTVFEHEGGHYVPCAKKFIHHYIDFFQSHPID